MATINVTVVCEMKNKWLTPNKATNKPSAILDLAEIHFFSAKRLLLKYFVL